jgi:hypothetical protein
MPELCRTSVYRQDSTAPEEARVLLYKPDKPEPRHRWSSGGCGARSLARFPKFWQRLKETEGPSEDEGKWFDP